MEELIALFTNNINPTFLKLKGLLTYLMQATNYVEFDHSFTDDEKRLAQALRFSCQLNNAACKLKMDECLEASKLCTKVQHSILFSFFFFFPAFLIYVTFLHFFQVKRCQ